jgi:hypothetical protein
MDQIEGTRLTADTCRMAKKPKGRTAETRSTTSSRPEAVRLGTAEAADIEKVQRAG